MAQGPSKSLAGSGATANAVLDQPPRIFLPSHGLPGPPPLHFTVARTALLDLLERQPQARVVVFRAPAGFGKTTTMLQWRQLRQFASVWETMQPHHADPEGFRALLTRLLGQVLGIGRTRAAPEGLLARLQTTALLKAPVALYLDDYHLAANATNDAVLARIVDALPPGLQLVLGTRQALDLPLEHHRLAGRLFEIGPERLCFSREETQAMFADLPGPPLPATALDALAARTLGWPAALRMGRSWNELGGSVAAWAAGLDGGDANLGSWLTEQVFDRLSPDLQSFLLTTCVTDTFSGELAAALTARRDSWGIIDRLDRLGLPLERLDRRGEWFRFHPLFLDFLRQRARRDGRDAILLHGRAAEWFDGQGDHAAAARHALAGGDPGRAGRILDKAGGWRQVMLGRGPLVAEVGARLGEADLLDLPSLRLGLALHYMKCGDVVGARQIVDAVRAAATAHDDVLLVGNLVDGYEDRAFAPGAEAALRGALARSVSDPLRTALVANILAARLLQEGRHDEVIALGSLSAEAYRAAGTPFGAAHALCHVGQAHFFLGRTEAAAAIYATIRDEVGAVFGLGGGLSAIADILAAECAVASGHLDGVDRSLDTALDLIERDDAWYDIYAAAYRARIDLALQRNDRAALASSVRRALSTARYRNLPRLAMLVITCLQAAEVERLVPADLRHALGSPAAWPADPRRREMVVTPEVGVTHDLTQREWQLLRLLADGLTLKEVAAALGVSLNTAKYHAKRLAARMGASRRSGILAEARRRGMLPPSPPPGANG